MNEQKAPNGIPIATSEASTAGVVLMFREISAKEAQSIVTKRMWVLLPQGYRWYSMVGTIEDIHHAKQAFGDSDAFYSFFRAEDEPLVALVGVDDAPVQMELF